MRLRTKLKLIRYMRKRGYGYPIRAVNAIDRANIKPAQALTLLKKETGGGRNVFGCDHGQGRAYCHEPVTFNKVQALRRSGLRNGIGPVQLTADAWVTSYPSTWGKVHRPGISMEAGFRGFKALVDKGSVYSAAKAYNGADAYARDFVVIHAAIEKSLRRAGVIK